ncbi:lateral flagellin [Pseudorhodoferax aquiterrae]|uniref:Flagellin n=1 Tax=Pseudorhodoferax aquiterrae TaxID=747304 RepID=A0ABQ3G4C0_9BURK|nr:flagellin [Pseudorhodoferax aquiterrae]GHC87039.1 lateral flagellin [Pseudorhodoferax aquiterrae]
MLSLHTNAASLSGQNALNATNKALSTSLTRLSTGYRVNSAMDDAAGLQIATRLNAQTRGMAVAQRNAQNGISMMQTAEGAFNEVTNILQRMKDLATEAATASASEADRDAMQAEFDQLGEELGNIMENTTFAGEKLFGKATTPDGKFGAAMTFQIGTTADETMDLDISTAAGDLNTALDSLVASFTAGVTAGTPGTEIAGTDGTAANGKITELADLLDDVGALRASLGAASNRLDHVYNNLSNMSINTEAARGRIMDVDYASESANMTTKQMLMQAGTSMLKQSNSMSQLALSLLQ